MKIEDSLLSWLLAQEFFLDEEGYRFIRLRNIHIITEEIKAKNRHETDRAFARLCKLGYIIERRFGLVKLRESPQPLPEPEGILQILERVSNPDTVRGLIEAHRLHKYYRGEDAEI